MPIKMTTDKNAIGEEIRKAIRDNREAFLYGLAKIGEEAVNQARLTAQKQMDWTDQSGNLRSSVGYAIYEDGNLVILSDFEQVQGPKGNNGEGSATGEALARQLGSEFPTGIVLVVVAGMKYASYVADKGYDVLASSEILAGQLVSDLVRNFDKIVN